MTFYEAPFYTETELEELDETQVHFPYSDIRATYIGKDHQYELTDKYFYERGDNLQTLLEGNDPEKVGHFLKSLRIKVYTFIYTHNRSTVAQLNFLIARRGLNNWDNETYRSTFLEAMYLEGVYLLHNGDLSKTSGVDLDTMQNMSEEVMRRQQRDFDLYSVGLLRQLGLNYYGRYKFYPQGMGVDW